MTKLRIKYYLSSCFLLSFLLSCQQESPQAATSKSDERALFTLLSPQQTNITFQNTLTEKANANVLMYEYFYNGGGVATGDFNGDGLVDIYFTSNMGINELYLNKGNLKFQNVTSIAGVGGGPFPWKTGVTVVDINGDNRLDIYVCYSGALPSEKRKNKLYLNDRNGTNNVPIFIEKAAEYGLDSPAYSNQGYFFDYDRDGDLDMVLLNHNPKALPILNEVKSRKLLKVDDPLQGIRLYQQNNGQFKDVTVGSGIIGSGLCYGLGIGISDVNNDGWLDFYVSNDYAVPDYLYINQKNGTFKNKLSTSIGHNSQFSMGNDIADINNDGWQDIVTLDMLPEDNRRQKLLMAPDNYAKFDLNVRSGFHYQYMRNMLQLNNANPDANGAITFSEIGQLAGISNTDWSWAALLADYDNDGWKDLYITNGYHRDYTNRDFLNYMDDFTKKKGRLTKNDVLELIKNMPSSDVVNYMFANDGGITFTNKTASWGMAQVANSNGAAYADLDNDGDLDLVVNNINKPAFVYENKANDLRQHHYLQIKLQGTAGNTQGIGAKVTVSSEGKTYTLEHFPSRGYLSSVAPMLHFGLGNLDTIETLAIQWPSGKIERQKNLAVNQVITLNEKNATLLPSKSQSTAPIFKPVNTPLPYQHPVQNIRDFNRQNLLTSELSHQGPCMVKGDINQDGRMDIFIGGAVNHAAVIYLQQKNKTFTKLPIPIFEQDKAAEDTDAAIFDANGDGYLDIYVASGGYHTFQPTDPLLQDRLYLNDGQGNFNKKASALPNMPTSTACIAVYDVNQDGHLDMFVGGRVIPGQYPKTPASYLLINDGQGQFMEQTDMLATELKNYGMVTDAVWSDLNGDNIKDLIIVGEWLPVTAFINQKGQLKRSTTPYFSKNYHGWWNTIEVADVNSDGKDDYIVGNIGTNTQFKASDSAPVELYFDDFDKNGSVDPLFCYSIQGKSYPYVTRDELLNQLAFLRPRFNSYESYADVTLTDIFKPKALKTAQRLTANHLETTLFLSNSLSNSSNSPTTFTLAKLPLAVQYSPIYAIQALDYNKDGHQDLILCGNNRHVKLRLGQFDANYGMLLEGNGTGSFTYISQGRSGLDLRGDVRCILKIDDVLLFGITGRAVVAYQ